MQKPQVVSARIQKGEETGRKQTYRFIIVYRVSEFDFEVTHPSLTIDGDAEEVIHVVISCNDFIAGVVVFV